MGHEEDREHRDIFSNTNITRSSFARLPLGSAAWLVQEL